VTLPLARSDRLAVALLVLALATWATVHPATARRRSAIDPHQPTVRRLDPALRAAVQAAAADAREDGVALSVTSGWRSRVHQQHLLDQAIAHYGSEAEARRFVATPQTSAHVTGDAVDIGPAAADDWLSRHGSAYGLCQVFANERWHFELATSPGGRCPPMLPDSSYR
jgi:LAS superfamily LD-carboxypeptidase LdcB